jgi:hypothetical protein
MIRLSLLLTLLLLLSAPVLAQTAANDDDSDDLLVDATWVPCSDTTESLFIFRDGRSIYARGDKGVVFTIAGALLTDLQSVMDRSTSVVETKNLDSCATLGVILSGPRFLLINSRHPTAETRDMQIRLERIRKLGNRKLDDALDRLVQKLEEEPDTAIEAIPSVSQRELQRRMRNSPIAQEWRCRGTVIVSAMIGRKGEVRRAFVRDARVRGKCSSLLTMTALRAVLLSTFKPALKRNGHPASAWIQVSVPFDRRM